MHSRPRLGVVAIAALALLATAPAASASDNHSKTIWVKPGTGTISAAAAKAHSGDTLRLKKGTYVDAVDFGSKGINVRGAGEGRSVVKLPSKLPKADSKNPCRSPDLGVAPGLCWYGAKHVSVRDLTTDGHDIGIVAVRVDGFTVTHTSGRHHDEYGVTAFGSHGITFAHNTEVGDGGEAGVYVGDTNDAAAVVAHNVAKGWTSGLFLRDARRGLAVGNLVTANCIGITVLDTGPNGSSPNPGSRPADTNNKAGDWRIVGNRVLDNTRFCPGQGSGPEAQPPLGGHGVAVIGAEHVTIGHNVIKGNNPPAKGKSAIPSSGVTIVNGKIAGGGPPSDVTVKGNLFKNKLDIFWDGSGSNIRFKDNRCTTSTPGGLCKS